MRDGEIWIEKNLTDFFNPLELLLVSLLPKQSEKITLVRSTLQGIP